MQILATISVEWLEGPILLHTVQALMDLLKIISSNASNPKFTHYLFEALVALLRSCKASPKAMEVVEANLIHTCQMMLVLDDTVGLGNNSELMPYIFQLFAGILEYRPLPGIPESLQPVLTALFKPTLWNIPDCVPALVRFLQACIFKDPAYLIQNSMLPGIIGIFNVLLSSRANDIYGFQLLNSVFQFIPM